MQRTLEIRVKTKRIPLSRTSMRALRSLDRYDIIVLTSKNARKFLAQALRQYHIKPPLPGRIIQVGPRADLLKLPLGGKHIFFPRSTLAPYDIVRKMRRWGAVVRVARLYTAYAVALSRTQRKLLLTGKIKEIYFKSPSGIDGLLRQVPRSDRTMVLAIRALCIGETTARAAKMAGFKQVSIKKL